VNKSFIKFITDFGPLLVFLTFYYKNEKNLTVAIPPFIVATLIALVVVWILEKKIPMVPLLGVLFLILFGGFNR
jgi:intracellular septation protein